MMRASLRKLLQTVKFCARQLLNLDYGFLI